MSLAMMIVLASSCHRPTIKYSVSAVKYAGPRGLQQSWKTVLDAVQIFALSDSSLKRMIVSCSCFGPSFRYCSSVGSASALDLDE